MTPSFSQGVDGHLAGCLGSLDGTAKCKSKALPGEREREREKRERGGERARKEREGERWKHQAVPCLPGARAAV